MPISNKKYKLNTENVLERRMSEYSTPTKFIDLEAQQNLIRSELNVAINKVLDHGQYIMGPEVGIFQDELKKFTGAENVITCANGTDALTLALMSLGVTWTCSICSVIYIYCYC